MRTLLVQMSQVLRKLPLQQVFAVSLAAVMLLITPIAMPLASTTVDTGVQSRLSDLEGKGSEGRPRTTGQFREQQENLEGQPGEVLERMGRQAADAFGEANETVGQTMKDLVPGVETDRLSMDD